MPLNKTVRKLESTDEVTRNPEYSSILEDSGRRKTPDSIIYGAKKESNSKARFEVNDGQIRKKFFNSEKIYRPIIIKTKISI